MNPSMAIHKQPLSSFPSVRQLRAFVAVYHTGSVSAAAQELSLTQPAVTMLLRELETKLGVSLFDRHTRALNTPVRRQYLLRRSTGEQSDTHFRCGHWNSPFGDAAP